MRLKIFAFVISLSFFSNKLLHTSTQSAVTMEKWHGQLGDRLILYIKAKYIAEKLGLPLIVKNFPEARLFAMQHLDRSHTSFPRTTKPVNLRQWDANTEQQLKKQIESGHRALYSVNYKIPTSPKPIQSHLGLLKGHSAFLKELQPNHPLIKTLKRTISPAQNLKLPTLEPDVIHTALHIRYNGKAKSHPEKFLPIDFYIKALQKLITLVPDQPMKVHLFTDHKNPKTLCSQLRNACKGNENITVVTSKEPAQNTILHDMFAIAQCDCLIRSMSSFSVVAQLIGNHHIVLSAKNPRWRHGRVTFDSIQVWHNPTHCKKDERFIPSGLKYVSRRCDFLVE